MFYLGCNILRLFFVRNIFFIYFYLFIYNNLLRVIWLAKANLPQSPQVKYTSHIV